MSSRNRKVYNEIMQGCRYGSRGEKKSLALTGGLTKNIP